MGLLRFLLAISVVIEHSNPVLGLKLYQGHMAVEMFFIISGFYMSLILANKYDTSSRAGLIDFYASRYLRLWPTFIITTAAAIAWWMLIYAYLGRQPTTSGPLHEHIQSSIGSLAVRASNITMFGQDVLSLFHVSAEAGAHPTFATSAPRPDGSLWLGAARIIGPAWTIGTEIWFYILVPFLFKLHCRWLGGLIAIGLLLRSWMEASGFVCYPFFPAQLPLFLLGMLAHRMGPSVAFFNRRVVAKFSLGAIFVVAPLYGLIGPGILEFKWLVYSFLGLSMAGIFANSKHSAIDRTIGELSYPIYITHILVIGVLAVLGKRVGFSAASEVVIPIVVLLSWAIYRWVDEPLARWRQRFATGGARRSFSGTADVTAPSR